MGRSTTTVVRLRGPFAGLDAATPRRALGAAFAADTLNMVGVRGYPEVRQPIRYWGGGTAWWTAVFSSLNAVGHLRIFTENYEYGDVWLYAQVNGNLPAGGSAIRNVIFGGDGQPVFGDIPLSASQFSSGPANVNGAIFAPDPIEAAYGRKIYRHEETWETALIGTVAPAAPTLLQVLVTVPPGAMPLGTYYYALRFKNSHFGTLSPMSNGASVAVADAGRTVRVWYELPTDAQVDTVQIYRMKVGLDDTYYYLTEGPVNAVPGQNFFDDVGTSPVKTIANRAPFGLVTPPPAQACAWHKNRMIYAPATSLGELWASEYGDPELVNALNSYGIGLDDGDSCYGLLPLGTYLYALKNGSLWEFYGDDPDTFGTRLVSDNIGCTAKRSAIVRGNAGYFLGRRGFATLDANGARIISEPVNPLLLAHDASYLASATAAYDEYYDALILNVPDATNGARQYVYHPATGSWHVWDYEAFAVGEYVYAGQRRAIFVGSLSAGDWQNYGEIGVLAAPGNTPWQDANSGAGQRPINYLWKTGDLDLGLQRTKKVFRVGVGFDRVPTAAVDSVTLGATVDQDDAGEATSTLPLSENPVSAFQRVGAACETVAVSVRGDATGRIRLTSIEIVAEPIGNSP